MRSKDIEPVLNKVERGGVKKTILYSFSLLDVLHSNISLHCHQASSKALEVGVHNKKCSLLIIYSSHSFL